MDILVLNYEYPPLGGGAAPVCRDLAEGMAKEGHRITVVTMGFSGLPEYEMHDGMEIYRLNCLRQKEHSCMPWEQYSYILAAKSFLKLHLKTHRYDACHTHFVIPTGQIALWVKEKFDIPYIITAHGSDVEGHNDKPYIKGLHRILRPAWKAIVREAYAVAAPSNYLLDLMKCRMQADKYVLIPNGLDIGKYRADYSQKEKRILLMGRMQKSKNFQTILKAVAMISDEIWDEWRVDLIGDGPYREELERFSSTLGIDSRVCFHGWIENGSQEQIRLLKRSSLYISASHFENCPMAVLEAMAAGCYPLLSDIEGHRQFFEREPLSEQFFFPADHVKVLSDKLKTRIKRKPLTIYNKRDLTDYQIDRISNQYIKLLQETAGFHQEMG